MDRRLRRNIRSLQRIGLCRGLCVGAGLLNRVCDVSTCSFQLFMEIVRSAAEVHTDRLHCMLLAVMLGKPTFAYPTAYAKLHTA